MIFLFLNKKILSNNHFFLENFAILLVLVQK